LNVREDFLVIQFLFGRYCFISPAERHSWTHSLYLILLLTQPELRRNQRSELIGLVPTGPSAQWFGVLDIGQLLWIGYFGELAERLK
jgi:hypothetical protein